MPAAAHANLRVERADAVATVTIDRPRALNALDPATLDALGAALRALGAAPEVRALVLTGSGERAFSAGADIAAMRAMPADAGRDWARAGHAVADALETFAVPVVAAVNGVALGGGLELALACDLIVASARARLGLPETNLGIIPGFGGTQRLVRRIGLARARQLIYLGETVPADEALRVGLVDRVVPPHDLAAEAARLAAALAARAPVALRAAKRATAAAFAGDAAAGRAAEIEAFGEVFATEDRVEGLRAFLEKRVPAWKGR